MLGLVYANAIANTLSEAERYAYINQHSPLAVVEMHRSGIPASITLAQAILESSWGQGELALAGNNYFGIKCKSDWRGSTYYLKDDDYNAQGELTKSCFRTYGSVYESFVDHTNFLMNRHFYTACFEHDANDYMSWAVSLQDAGYATAKDYALRLVDLIERYQLYHFDEAASKPQVEYPMVVHNPVKSEPQAPVVVETNTTVVEPTPPAVVDITTYEPAWKNTEMATRTGTQKIPSQGTYKIVTRRTTPHNSTYTRTNKGTYKNHTRVMPYYPAASNERRRD